MDTDACEALLQCLICCWCCAPTFDEEEEKHEKEFTRMTDYK